ncbi:hypothetical protein [Aminobacter niigataensis]|nr:hypothetical protein [Aminobacter niigataensis]
MMELFKTQFDFLSRWPRGGTTALPFQAFPEKARRLLAIRKTNR